MLFVGPEMTIFAKDNKMELEVLENLLRWLEQKQNLKKLSPKSEMLCVIEMELVKNQMISTGNKLLHTPLGTEPLLQTPQCCSRFVSWLRRLWQQLEVEKDQRTHDSATRWKEDSVRISNTVVTAPGESLGIPEETWTGVWLLVIISPICKWISHHRRLSLGHVFARWNSSTIMFALSARSR